MLFSLLPTQLTFQRIYVEDCQMISGNQSKLYVNVKSLSSLCIPHILLLISFISPFVLYLSGDILLCPAGNKLCSSRRTEFPLVSSVTVLCLVVQLVTGLLFPTSLLSPISAVNNVFLCLPKYLSIPVSPFSF
jgi:hypothetical protein